MIYRSAVDNIAGSTAYPDTSRHYVFIGFNALSECEKRVLKYLNNNCKCDFVWDYDTYYVSQKEQEAGHFLRENISLFKSSLDISHNNFTNISKSFSAISTASNALQCKYVNQLLRNISPTLQFDKRTAIVLTDESLLLPLLHALPEELQKTVRLVICCRGNLKRLQKLAHRMGVDDIVDFIIPDFDLLELFPAADLLLYPARNETSGIAPLESIASGIPVLASPNHGWDHIVQESGSIVLPSPFRRENLVSALRMLLLAPERIEEMKRQASEYARTADFYRRSEFAADAITGVVK
jgi:glycosyltransferase involved in cell wall biosynthesis